MFTERLPTMIREVWQPVLWLLGGELLAQLYLRSPVWAEWFVAPRPFYPPQGVILAALLLTQRRYWAPLIAVHYVLMVVSGLAFLNVPLWYLLSVNVANVIEPLLGVVLFRRWVPGPTRFASLTSVAVLVGSTTLAALIGATWAATIRMGIGASFEQAWTTWFLGDVLASIVFAPTIVLWATARRDQLA